MGRKAKYATVQKYQLYIDAIRKDLGFPDDFIVDISFGVWRKMGGDGGMRNNRGVIRLNRGYSHKWTVQALMHEFRHVWQFYHSRLQRVYDNPIKVGTIKSDTGKSITFIKRSSDGEHGLYLWDNKVYLDYAGHCMRNDPLYDKYRDQPWEIDARNYENQIDRLFPTEFSKP